jgi:hypothetical protein
MITDGGGWTLVAQNSSSTTAPTPNYASAVGYSSTMNGTLGLGSCDLWVGLSNWNIGTQLLYQVGSAPGVVTNSTRYNFSLNSGSFYALTLTSETVLAGGISSGFFTYHSGKQLTTSDSDHDLYVGNCSSTSGGNTPFWYNNCWLGSIWGSGGTNGAHWDTSSGAGNNWGAIWIR